MKDLQLENKLSSQYTQLLASAKIDFAGKKEHYHSLFHLCKEKKEVNVKQRVKRITDF